MGVEAVGSLCTEETIVLRATGDGSPEPLDLPTLTSWVEIDDSCTFKDDSCPICMDGLLEDPARKAVRLGNCTGHGYHADCITDSFKHKPMCPVCSFVYSPLLGNQPDGTMRVKRYPRSRLSLEGHEAFGVIQIDYHFPSGRQGSGHPHPGVPFQGTSRVGYLPDSPEGNEVGNLLKRAFRARLTFQVGRSVTTGQDNCVVWNGIHHKTSPTGGETSFGYPDATYLQRVKSELALKGILPPS